MPTYHYKARDKFAKAVTGVMGGESEEAVAAKLSATGHTPISIQAVRESQDFSRFLGAFQRVSLVELNMFTREFAVLQKAGLPILSSLNMLKGQLRHQGFKDCVAQIARDIEGGSSLSSALGRHPLIFEPLYANMISSGEESGRLGEALQRLATLGEYEEQVRMRIKAATRYPIMVIAAIIIGFIVLTLLVIPRFAKIYAQFTTELPVPTKMLIGFNNALVHHWWAALILLPFFCFGFKRLTRLPRGRRWWDTMKLKMPVFGPLVLKLSMSRFCRMTGVLMKSGVPMLKILGLAAAGAGNVVIAKAIDQIRESVSEGRGMTEPMKASGLFPATVIQMVSVGEETGKLDELLLHVSDYYDTQIDYTTNNLTSLIEPMLILILGCAVLFMALGIFLPMWNMANLFKR